VESFLSNFGKKINAKILIFGNNDVDFIHFHHELPKSVKRVYLQNSYISDEFFFTLPIGIENLSYYRNGLPRLFREELVKKVKNGRALVGPFGNTHDDRQSLMALSSEQHGKVDFIHTRLSPTTYANKSSEYSFVFCPRGNGLDTHRFWETLYRGSLPVVIKSKWSDSIAKLGVPLLAVSNWQEALEIVNSESFYFRGQNPHSVPSLWEDYWAEQIRGIL
jgi:hypothetical protein